MATTYSITVCLLLLTCTAVVKSSDAITPHDCWEQFNRCNQVDSFVREHEDDLETIPGARRVILDIGVDELCGMAIQDLDCAEPVLTNPTCAWLRRDPVNDLEMFRDIVDYGCSQEGKQLMLASLESSCFATQLSADVYIRNTLMCFMPIQKVVDSTESPELVSQRACPLLPELADCVVNTATDTCGADFGQFVEGLRPQGLQIARSELHCHEQDNRTFRKFVWSFQVYSCELHT